MFKLISFDDYNYNSLKTISFDITLNDYNYNSLKTISFEIIIIY